MKVAIAGAGVSGSYLASCLAEKGFTVDLYDLPHQNACSISPCAWMATREIGPRVRAAGLDPDRYILNRFSSALFQGREFGVDLMTIDKPALVRDLRGNVPVRYGSPDPDTYDRVIDATGTARAFLPPIVDDRLVPCIQYRGTADNIRTMPEIRCVYGGYAWSFPLGDGRCHVGCLSHAADPASLLKDSGLLDGMTTECGCRSRLRVTSPAGALPFVAGKIWGIGEAIGGVYPLLGDGIVPALRSVGLILGSWNDPEAYRRAVLSTFSPMSAEHNVLTALNAGRRVGLRDILGMNFMRVGMQVSPGRAREAYTDAIAVWSGRPGE
jgi:flavin-dependent dehydrogenase